MQSSNICPATMFDSNRSAKLIDLNRVDINSIGGNINSNTPDPCGQNRAKYLSPHLLNPINSIPNHVMNPNPSVTDRLLVIVKLNGNNPIKLNNSININM